MHEVLVNRLGGLGLPRKSVVRLTDRSDMTLEVYRGRKTTNQQLVIQNTPSLKKLSVKDPLSLLVPTQSRRLVFFAEKNVRMQKFLTNFQQQKIVFAYNKLEILTTLYLRTLIVLNNWAMVFQVYRYASMLCPIYTKGNNFHDFI